MGKDSINKINISWGKAIAKIYKDFMCKELFQFGVKKIENSIEN